MDTFWSDFWNPGAIVRTIILMVVIPLLLKAVYRYWSNRSIKSIQRRIKYAEDRKLLIAYLSTSDRSILLFSFRTLFVLLAMVSFIFVIPSLLSIAEGDINPKNDFIILIWIVIVFSSMYASQTLKEVDDYPKSLDIINQKISELKARLSKFIGGKDANV